MPSTTLQFWLAFIAAFFSIVPGSARTVLSAAIQDDIPQEVSSQEIDLETDRQGYLVRVALPIDQSVSQSVIQTLKRLAEQSPTGVRTSEFPVVVLEFDTSGGRTGQGSDLEACQKLARYLTHPDFINRLQTVAYVPSSRGFVGVESSGSESQLNGHAVLVAVAANQLAMETETAIGKAGIDEPKMESLIEDVYRDIAGRSLTLPVPVVMSMLEKSRQLFRVVLMDGRVEYTDEAEAQRLEASGQADKTTTISQQGVFTLLTSEQLVELRLVRLNPTSKTDLARMLDLVPGSLEGNPVESVDWKAVQLDLPTYIDKGAVNWIIRSLNQQTNQGVNLIILNIDDNDGELTSCFRLARHLSEYQPNEIRTVAFVRNRAQGPVGLLALSCSHLIMSPNARLGGRDELETRPELTESELAEIQPLVLSLAEQRQTDWSMMMAMLNPGESVSRYQNKRSGQIRLMGNEELKSVDDLDDWAPLGPISVTEGMDAQAAEQNFLARTIADNMGQVKMFYQLAETPTELRQSSTDQWIEQVAAYLASPMIATWLLFGAMFFFSTEMSAPGVGLPGFLATICVVLFFWSQNLGGNADWLEIILFVIGGIFILMEIFLLPGLGVFGIGGFVMVVSSIILASQSFLIPKTTEQIAQMPYSVLPVLGAGMGVITAAVLLRNVIPKSPFLRRMMLVPRKRANAGIDGQSDPEALVDWSYLAGQSGDTVTQLHPSGKARISGRVYDVISNGQLIDKGDHIEVIEVLGNRIVVRPLKRKDDGPSVE